MFDLFNTQREATQRVFGEALAHIREQGEPSINAGSVCMYKHPDGLGCAFSPAIMNYTPRMEFKKASSLLRYRSDHLHEWARDAHPIACDYIQRAHDGNKDYHDFLDKFEESMKNVAELWKLNYEPESA